MTGQWERAEGGSRPVHVYPVNDLREHVVDAGSLCPCIPRIKHADPVDTPDGLAQPDHSHDIIVHNSYDGREIGEVCRKALDGLGKALANHSHAWTPQERDDYEHAIQVLDMHYPSKGPRMTP